MQPVHHSLVLLPDERLKRIMEFLPAASCIALGDTNRQLYKIATEVLFERLHGRDCSLNLYSSLYGKWHSELLPNSEQLTKVVAREIRCQVANVLHCLRDQRTAHAEEAVNPVTSICYWDELDENPASEVSSMIKQANEAEPLYWNHHQPQHRKFLLGIEKISIWVSSRPGNSSLMTADQTFPTKALMRFYGEKNCLHTLKLLLEIHTHQNTNSVEETKLAKELYSATHHKKPELIHLLREQLPSAFHAQPLGDGNVEKGEAVEETMAQFFAPEPPLLEKASYKQMLYVITEGYAMGFESGKSIDLNETDSEGNTLLHHAINNLFLSFLQRNNFKTCLNRNLNICFQLIYAGANPIVQNHAGLTPLELIAQKKAKLESDRAWSKRWIQPLSRYLYTSAVFLASPTALTITLAKICINKVYTYTISFNSLINRNISLMSITNLAKSSILITIILISYISLISISLLLLPLSAPYILLTGYMSGSEALASGACQDSCWLGDCFSASPWMDQEQKDRLQKEEKNFSHFLKEVKILFNTMAEEGARPPPHPSAEPNGP